MLSTISPCSCTIVARSWEPKIPHNLETLGRTPTLKMVFTSTISDSSWRMLCSRCSSWPSLSSSSIISWVLWRKGLASQLTKNVNCKEIIVIYANGVIQDLDCPCCCCSSPGPASAQLLSFCFAAARPFKVQNQVAWSEQNDRSEGSRYWLISLVFPARRLLFVPAGNCSKPAQNYLKIENWKNLKPTFVNSSCNLSLWSFAPLSNT